nr:MAG TPA: hypothetical protein [Caudoviricetes sp.]
MHCLLSLWISQMQFTFSRIYDTIYILEKMLHCATTNYSFSKTVSQT